MGIPGTGVESSQHVFDSLAQLGCSFFNFSPQYPLEKFGSANGDILPNAGLFHDVLAQSARMLVKETDAADLPMAGDGNFCFTESIRHFSLDQAARTDDLTSFNLLADRQTAFLKVLATSFQPQLATIDEMGENVGAPDSIISKRSLTRLFWYVLFGPAYCEKYGKHVFLKAPAYRTEDLGDIGVTVQATRELSQWLDEPMCDLVEYFGSGIFPGIKPYRARRP
jgi:hypothetical protein